MSEIEAIRRFDTCTIANAIERFGIRPRNEGYITGEISCRFPKSPPVVGHAVTGRIQTYMPPITGRCYYDHEEWWRHLMTTPEPRIVVFQDVDSRPGFGAIFGEVHARLCQALNCVACITNGAVRDLDAIEPLGFQLFSGSLSVSHAYAHIVDFGEPVEIGQLRIGPGDILHADRNGVHSIPPELLSGLPAMAEQVQAEEQELLQLARAGLSVDVLAKKLKKFAEKQTC